MGAFIAVLGFASCSNGSSSGEDSETDFNSKQALKFDLTNAKAIASVEESSSRNIAARASSSNLNSPLIKILDSSGNETGAQNIYMFDTNSGKFENLFEKVPVELEIISYSAGNGKLYFSAVKGISLLNGTIDLETKEFTRLDTENKLTSMAAY